MFRLLTILVVTVLGVALHFWFGLNAALDQSWAWTSLHLGLLLPWGDTFLKVVDEVQESAKVAK